MVGRKTSKKFLLYSAAVILVLVSGLGLPTIFSDARAQEAPSITIDILTDNPAKWGNEVQVFGSVTGASDIDHNVTVSWDDGSTPDSGVTISDAVWGIVSHTYDSAAIGTRNITVQLINGTGHEVASNTIALDVLEHSTFISFDPIADTIQGQQITVTGTLFDSDTGSPISDAELQFNGSGGSGLVNTVTDLNGFFNSIGPAPDIAEDGLVVNASIVGSDIYDDPIDSLITYNTISTSAISYDVSDGTNVRVNLTEFGISIDFENVATGGTLLVYDCSTPDNSRYLDLSPFDICVSMKPSIVMADGSAAQVHINITEGDSLPSGHDFADLHIFRISEDSTTADITLSIDEENNQITGETLAFSKLVVSVPEYPPSAEHSRRVPILLGDSTIDFRDVESTSNASALIEIDDSTLSRGEETTLRITDPDGNINPDLLDSVEAFVYSDTSQPQGITLELQETAISSGIFEGTFEITTASSSGNTLQAAAGDSIMVNYTQSAGRLRAVVEGISEAGIAEMLDYTIDPTQVVFMPIGGAVELSFVDAQLGPEGSITVTMSYANAITRGQDPVSFRLFHLENGAEWVDITLSDGDGNVIGVDTTAMTVTGQTTSLSPFSIGVFTGVPGGAGGGGFTGRGVVVDAVASIVRSGSGGGGGGSSSSSTGASLSSVVTSLSAGLNVNVAATVTPSSTVNLQFDNVVTGGNIAIEEKSPASLSSIFSEVTQTNAKVIFGNGLIFTTLGTVFEISPSSDVSYQGMIGVTIPYDRDSLAGSSSSDVRLLHFNGKEWEDVTIHIDENAGTVTGLVNTLSPVVAALVNDGTFGAKYFEQNPMARIVDIDESGGMLLGGESQIVLLDEDGLKLANIESISVGSKISVVNSIKNLQRISQSYSYIFEVLDSNGVVVDLQEVKTGTLKQGQTARITADWTAPIQDGEYTFKIFVIDDESSQASLLLKNSISTKVGVT